jgi:hypothetical protein
MPRQLDLDKPDGLVLLPPALVNMNAYASQVQATAKQQGYDINDADGRPIKEPLTDPQKSFLYGLLLQGMR